MASVLIPVPLRKLTNNTDTVFVNGITVEEVINNLEAGYPGIKERVCYPDGEIRQFINIYLNNEDVRFLNGRSTAVKDTDEISLVPAMAGG
jgi:molybdopterin synthase sulfur carrier subunit